MCFLRRIGLLLVFLFSVSGESAAQHVIVQLDTNLPTALVYADSTLIGAAATKTFRIPEHTRRLRLLPPREKNWSITPVSTALSPFSSDTLRVSLPFPYHYQVETVPYGASVVLKNQDGEQLLGDTPVLYKSTEVLTGTLIVEKQGYLTQEVATGAEVWNRYVLTLEPFHVDDVQSAERDWHPPRKRRRWIDYTAAVMAVTAGAISIHYKFKADRLNDEYTETGNPALRPRINALDDRAGIALGVMQAGLGVLAVRFILR